MIGYFAAGWLNEFYGWRTTFVVLSLPGLALAVLAWFTLKEPQLKSMALLYAALGGVSALIYLSSTQPAAFDA